MTKPKIPFGIEPQETEKMFSGFGPKDSERRPTSIIWVAMNGCNERLQ